MKKVMFLAGLAVLAGGIAWAYAVQGQPAGSDELPAVLLGKGGAPQGESVAYFSADPAAKGYLAVPDGSGPFGGVILIHEWNGLVDRIRQVADTLAAEGYVVLAADLYSGRTGSSRQENQALVAEVRADEGKIIANLNAAASFLRQRQEVSGKIATIGWCFGGGVALSYALGGENHQATAIFYGRLLDDPQQMSRIHHEIYGTFGALDRGIPPEQVENFVAALRQAGVPNDVHIYDEVGHGFWLYVERNPDKATQPALDAWKRLKAYLARTIGG